MYWLYIFAFTGLAALLFFVLLHPLLKEQERGGKKILLGLVIAVPLLSLVIYQQRGAIDEVILLADMQGLAQTPEISAEDVNAGMLGQLESYVERNPDDAEYWFLLGEMRMETGNFQGALNAFQQASGLRSEDTSIYSRMAEARFFLDGYQLTQEVRNYIDVVLENNPNDTTVMGILGISAYRAQQYEAAVRFWERALQNLPPSSASAASIRASIEQARIAGGLAEENNAEGNTGSAAAEEVSLDVLVSLGEGIEFATDDAVFIFARQYDGSPMPIVARRLAAGSLPARVTLDDSGVMMQGRSLADFSQLELVARLSLAGTPTPQPGDYQVVLGPVNPAEIDSPITLEITDLIE